MKRLVKILFSSILLLSLNLTLFSCSKINFDYPLDDLYGTWEGTDICVDGKWYSLENPAFKNLRFSITFHEDGTYYGKGAFGTGAGTYELDGKTITTFVNDQEFLKYVIKSLVGNRAELTMYDRSSSMEIKVKKIS